MREFIGASAAILLGAVLVEGKHGLHNHLQELHARHRHHREVERSLQVREGAEEVVNNTVSERGVTCAFPTDLGLVPVTQNLGNGGWAFAPDQACTSDRNGAGFCPYACPPGQVSMQWDPAVTSYTYPGSMNGGLKCNSDGTVSKPIPENPYCQETATNIGVTNNAGSVVTFCQTVLPGDEDMLIPTEVSSWSSIAIPGPSYWATTAAHYYIQPPGTSGSEGCIWGSSANPTGNWAAYVAGGNVDASGNTFIKLGWNPIYLQPTTPFRNTVPSYGVRIECEGQGCNGLPCAIDPTQNGVNEMIGGTTAGAGGGTFCVVTVPQGVSANFVVFTAGGSQADNPQGGKFYAQGTSLTQSSTAPSTTATAATTATATTQETNTSTTMSLTSQETSSLGSDPDAYYALFNDTATGTTQTLAPSPTEARKTASRTPQSGSSSATTNGASIIDRSATLLALALLFSLL